MDIKKFLPHVYATVILMVVSAVFFAPNAFNGKVLPQPDNDKARGMQTEIHEYIEKEGRAPLWTNSAFGGMPSYQIYSPVEGNYTEPIFRSLFLWSDVSSVWVQVFVAMLCMYFMLRILNVDWRIALLGALGYGISTYNVDILEAGHTTKMLALAMAPAVLAGIILMYRGRFLLGGGITALFISMQLFANHVQITYYTLLLSGIWGIAALVEAVRNKEMRTWAIASVVALLSFTIGFGSNLSRIWPTYEYSQETIRGKSDLNSRTSKGDGLDKDYLFGWSYGVAESFTLLVPHFAGGGAGESPTGTKLYKAVSRQFPPNMSKRQIDQQVASLLYSGDQPFVGTAIYFGAILIFLSILGAILVPGAPKWWLLGSGLFMVTLAWGKNFFLNDILYDIMPMFNKFRAVSMALGPAQLCFAALAAMGLQAFLSNGHTHEEKSRALMISAGITAVLALLAILFASSSGPNDAALAQNPELLNLLAEDRAGMVRTDAFRSIAFIGLGALLLWLYLKGRVPAGPAALTMALLCLIDVWTVCTRTLTPAKWENKKQATSAPAPQPFDLEIQKDPDIHYRVLDLSRGSISGNATTSYFHKSLSGYHAAKLQRYQEVADSILSRKLGSSLHIVGMLNGKYIVNQEQQVSPNPQYIGDAWFVNQIQVVPTADDEFHGIETFDPKETVLIWEKYADAVKGFQPEPDSTATIELSSYHPDKMVYTYSAEKDQFAVFSEVYYPPSKGWNCYLNGEPFEPFTKVNYLLRGMRLPAGQNQQLEMRFEPRSFYVGESVSRVASILAILGFLGGLWFLYKNPVKAKPAQLVDMEKTEAAKPTEKNRTAQAAGPKAKRQPKKRR